MPPVGDRGEVGRGLVGAGDQGEWTPAFPGQRPPFQPGHQLTREHGAYSQQAIEPLQEAILERLRLDAPVGHEADDHARRLLAGRLAQIEIARRWIAENGILNEQGELWPLVRDLTKWEGGAVRQMRELGLTTLSRAELGLDLARTHVAIAEVQPVFTAIRDLMVRYVAPELRAAFLKDYDRALGTFGGSADGA